jgi:hypothetical protein
VDLCNRILLEQLGEHRGVQVRPNSCDDIVFEGEASGNAIDESQFGELLQQFHRVAFANHPFRQDRAIHARHPIVHLGDLL